MSSQVKTVTAEYQRASRFNRYFAGVIDLGLLFGCVIPLYHFLFDALPIWWSWTAYLLPVGFLLGKDAIAGRSIGKRLLGLVTLNLDTNTPAGVSESVLRNWFLAVVIVPPDLFRLIVGHLIFGIVVVIVGLQILFCSKTRLGDKLAHTQVIDAKYLTAGKH